MQLQINIDLILFTEQEFLDIIRPDLDNINFETFVLRNLKISHNLETSKQQTDAENFNYCKVSKFSDARKLWCNLPKILEKRPNLSIFRQKDANEIANSEDPDQTAPLGEVWSGSALFAQTYLSENFGSLWYNKMYLPRA